MSNFNYMENDDTQQPTYSASLEGAENIVITKLFRAANLSGYGFVSFEDSLTIKNFNDNPITSIMVGIPLADAEELVFFRSAGDEGNTLYTERSNMVIDDYEMFAIYFDSPLLPYQTKSIKFLHQYKNLITYVQAEKQILYCNTTVFPILPYRAEGDIKAYFYLPKYSDDINGSWGFEHEQPQYFIRYELVFIESQIGDLILTPYLENLNNLKYTNINFTHGTVSKMEITEINREIYISPWGIVRVKEDFTIENLGILSYTNITLSIPARAKDVAVSDDLGEMDIIISSPNDKGLKELLINFITNRIQLIPHTSYRFSIKYYLPFDKYYSTNWFQGSIQLDILTTKSEFLGRNQIVKIVIDGCNKINHITEPPEIIKKSHGTVILTYESDFVTPFESNVIQFAFTIDLFDLLFRPIIFMIIIASIASIYVLTVKTRKKERDMNVLKREFIPVNEIREFCSLYEEKNALTLEIRQAEENARRKKIAKKNYKNILDKNTLKIDQILQEIYPFKKVLLETNITFENVIKRLDLLEAERISVKDSLNLLESRYKRGRLPSRAAYQKLSDDFKKRRRKIERNIDKLIQQLRSYLL
ncbi:MAG: hypothetical protein ACFFB0_21070 [Promethearchaeota archaeon]